MATSIRSVVVDPRPTFPLRVCAIHIVPQGSRPSGSTLLFLHATGVHKETWLPLIECLAKRYSGIRDIWSIECPNHGESAVMNEKELESNPYTGWMYPRAVHAFLSAKEQHGVDFRALPGPLIGVGHSMGGTSLPLLQTLQPTFPVRALVLLDGTISPETPDKARMLKILAFASWTKTDTWASRKAALKELSKSPGFRSWHPKSLELFVTHALRTHPADAYPEPHRFRGVTLSCSRVMEASCHRAQDHHPAALASLRSILDDPTGPPVYFVVGRTDEFNAGPLKQMQAQWSKECGRGGVYWVEKGTHMFPQQEPELAAQAIADALTHFDGGKSPARARL
ncbi:alpha/beta-hydrolase [Exidia glandulosa HHB12029]|uniref:Alpha/beta-hydrolase n=1 Tax=Exidia glandulosa HHB12029 TaxID=1314781 RepID=A0A165DHG5_EXIGL|nr:alpha/beta-hydrolase [Exidia glandulosa HHB12029]